MGSAATAPGVLWLCEGLRPPPTPYSLPPVSSFSHQGMVFRVADHAGIPLAGLSADGRVLSGFVPSEFINHSFVYDAPLPFYRPTIRLADKCRSVSLGSHCLADKCFSSGAYR